MAWIILKDHQADLQYEAPSNLNAVGMTGPSTALDETLARLNAGEGAAFKMFDGDSELYYEGLYLEDERENANHHVLLQRTTDEFQPLEDFGAPNAGCAYIEYQNPEGKWEML